jgi:hypothetical protein
MNFSDAGYTINEIKKLQKYEKRREGFIPPSVEILSLKRTSDTVRLKFRLDVRAFLESEYSETRNVNGVNYGGVTLSEIEGVKFYVKNWNSNNFYNQDIYNPNTMEEYLYLDKKYNSRNRYVIEDDFVYTHTYNSTQPMRNKDNRKVIIGIYPYTKSGAMNKECVLQVSLTDAIVYKFKLNEYYSDPNKMITYPQDCDNSFFKPADSISYRNNNVSSKDNIVDIKLNSWEDAFFLPRPCMLRWDGTVDYYLDIRDYRRKDGLRESSNISDPDYDGNAMMEWGRHNLNGTVSPFYWCYEPTSDNIRGGTFTISTHRVNEKMDAWNFYNYKNELADAFYTGITHGVYSYDITNSKFGGKRVLRSILPKSDGTNTYKNKLMIFNSGQSSTDYAYGATGLHYVKNINNKIYNVDTFNNLQLSLFLIMLMFKSPSLSKVVFDKGNGNPPIKDNNIIVGDDKYTDFFISGLFDGHKTNAQSGYTPSKGVIFNKIFGMYCGLFTKEKRRVTLGCFIDIFNRKIYSKMRYNSEDKTLNNGYFKYIFIDDKDLNNDNPAVPNEYTPSERIKSKYNMIYIPQDAHYEQNDYINNMIHGNNMIIPIAKSFTKYSDQYIKYSSIGRYSSKIRINYVNGNKSKLFSVGGYGVGDFYFDDIMADDSKAGSERRYTFGLTCVPLTDKRTPIVGGNNAII